MMIRAGDGCEFVDDGIADASSLGGSFQRASIVFEHQENVPFADQVTHVINHFQSAPGMPALWAANNF